MKCINCGADIDERSRRCRECRRYWNMVGRERPPEYWHLSPEHGWCDCGAPATRVVRVRIRRHMDWLRLCDRCWRLEQEIRATPSSLHYAGAAIRATMRW
ncbi:MAG: hypothetical protein KatS3mg051_1022 [Anaerolineae bacterium]|nr:MAG: hypothetical protein KatS3mg051_1022 [Anaerolineae bacterium]